MKRRLIVAALTLAMSVSIFACGSDNAVESTSPETTIQTPAETEPQLPLGFKVLVQDYRNDGTGKWKVVTIAETAVVSDLALDYYNNYFEEEDEIHFIVNFTHGTTTKISKMANLLDVCTYEYTAKEEHDAKLACSGQLLTEYHIDIETGEAEQIQ